MKRVRYQDGELDAIDMSILEVLAREARLPMRELAERVGLSGPSTAERVRRLEENGVIRGYGAVVDPAAIGRPLGAYLRVRPMPGELDRVAAMLASMPAVTMCDRVTGDDCFIAKVQVVSMAALETLINQLLPYSTTNTSVVVSTPVVARMPGLAENKA
ncbi:MAG: Lrp/AsnC family transcriptional regulator [Telluria sp.]